MKSFDDYNLPEIRDVQEEAMVLMKSGMLPPAIRNQETLIATLMLGKKLGIDSLTAVTNIRIENGQLIFTPELMYALISSSKELIDIIIANYDDQSIVTIKRQGRTEQTVCQTIKEAKALNCLNRQNWILYPDKMLSDRAFVKCARLTFPEIIRGAITPDELLDKVPADQLSLPTSSLRGSRSAQNYWPVAAASLIAVASLVIVLVLASTLFSTTTTDKQSKATQQIDKSK